MTKIDIAMCNDCSKCYCWEWDTKDITLQCPHCRSENIITDKCTIASVMNMLNKATEYFVKALMDKPYDYRAYAKNIWIKDQKD